MFKKNTGSQTQTVIEVATSKGVIIKMTVIDDLIQLYPNGDVRADLGTCIDTMKALMRLIADGRNKHKKVSHYKLHLECLNAWCQLVFPNWGVLKIARAQYLDEVSA